MINFQRRKRQANQNASIVLDMFYKTIKNQIPLCVLEEDRQKIFDECSLDQVIEKVNRELADVLCHMEPDWAIPIMVEAVGKVYYGELKEYQIYGTVFKRTLAYLWKGIYDVHGSEKNLHQLETLISYSFVLESLYSLRKMFWAIDDFFFYFEKGYISIPAEFEEYFEEYIQLGKGRGKRFRVAEENSRLMNEESIEYFQALADVLKGKKPSDIDIFKNNFYEMIPGIENAECKKFWQELFFRYSFYLFTLGQSKEEYPGTEVVLFHEFAVEAPEGILTQEVVENAFWKLDWFENQKEERYGNLVVDRPILRISVEGDFATSAVLIGDSINSFIEKQIFHYGTRNKNHSLPQDIFRKAFSDPFEQKCIDYFRKNSFWAGHVSEKGIWKIQHSDINLNVMNEKIYGEVDVLAYHESLHMLLLVECKVLNEAEDTRSYKNLVAKLRDDDEGYRKKSIAKGNWVKKSFKEHYNLEIEPVLILLTDIPLPVLNIESDIIYTNFIRLTQVIDKILNEAKE